MEHVTIDGKPLKEVIATAMDERGVNIKKLTETTGIPERFVMFFLEGELRKLPPAPYVRGYLTKIARALDLNHDDLFNRYRGETGYTSSGSNDRLPGNRFVIQSAKKKMVVGIVVVLIAIAYLGWNAQKLIGAPSIEVTEPADDTITTTLDQVTIAGKTDVNNKLTINQEQLYLGSDGSFHKDYGLQIGLNTFEITAKKFLGREVTVVKKIILEVVEEKTTESKSNAKLKKETKELPTNVEQKP